MCTVTFVPTRNGFLLTSSRDEKKIRPTIYPKLYFVDGRKIYFPKDEVAGGTWIATDNKHRTVCLLNGAFENHVKLEHYRKSRGLILLESFSFTSINDFVTQVNLQNIEPFTLLLLDTNPNLELIELRWDGLKKYIKNLDVNLPHIWSSATLYNKTIRDKREEWFKKLLSSDEELTKVVLQQFHFSKKDDDLENDIIMKRENGLQTVSISQVIVENNSKEFRYFDIITNQHHSIKVNE
jgi:hypothetical protein